MYVHAHIADFPGDKYLKWAYLDNADFVCYTYMVSQKCLLWEEKSLIPARGVSGLKGKKRG